MKRRADQIRIDGTGNDGEGAKTSQKACATTTCVLSENSKAFRYFA
jgi:hypothetical protein